MNVGFDMLVIVFRRWVFTVGYAIATDRLINVEGMTKLISRSVVMVPDDIRCQTIGRRKDLIGDGFLAMNFCRFLRKRQPGASERRTVGCDFLRVSNIIAIKTSQHEWWTINVVCSGKLSWWTTSDRSPFWPRWENFQFDFNSFSIRFACRCWGLRLVQILQHGIILLVLTARMATTPMKSIAITKPRQKWWTRSGATRTIRTSTRCWWAEWVMTWLPEFWRRSWRWWPILLRIKCAWSPYSAFREWRRCRKLCSGLIISESSLWILTMDWRFCGPDPSFSHPTALLWCTVPGIRIWKRSNLARFKVSVVNREKSVSRCYVFQWLYSRQFQWHLHRSLE